MGGFLHRQSIPATGRVQVGDSAPCDVRASLLRLHLGSFVNTAQVPQATQIFVSGFYLPGLGCESLSLGKLTVNNIPAPDSSLRGPEHTVTGGHQDSKLGCQDPTYRSLMTTEATFLGTVMTTCIRE